MLQDETGHQTANALHEFFGNDAYSTTAIVQDTNVDDDDHLFNFKKNGAWNDKVNTMNSDMNRIYLTRQTNMGGQTKLLVIVLNKQKNGTLEMRSVVPHSNAAAISNRYSPLGNKNIRNLSALANYYPQKVQTLGITAEDSEDEVEEEYTHHDEVVAEYDNEW